MHTDDELARFKGILLASIVLLISTAYSWWELKYRIWGRTAQASISRAYETRSTSRRGKPRLAVEYTFTDLKSGSRNERDDVRINWPLSGDEVLVEYIPGVDNSSRLLGNSNQLAVWIFFACVGWLNYQGVALYQEATEPIQKIRNRR